MLPITSGFAFAVTIIIIYLAFQVVYYRRKLKVGYGDNNQTALSRAIAAHSNAVENIPIAILLMLLLEINQVDKLVLIVIATAFVLARIIHAYGLSHHLNVSFGRTYGTLISWLLIVLMATINLVTVVW